jgi:hypothetical protein
MVLSVRNIAPVFVAHDRQAFEHGSSSAIFRKLAEIEREATGTAASFVVKGYCIPCDRSVPFAADNVREGGSSPIGVSGWCVRAVRCRTGNA